MRFFRFLLGTIAALIVLLWRLSCRYRFINDPRPRIRTQFPGHLYALLHAHQIHALFANDDRIMSAMVSKSKDGDFLIPLLRLRRVIPVRGSSRLKGRDKGGRTALREQAELVKRGVPALIAVDGPRGPRNFVHRGVADLAFETGFPVIPFIIFVPRRWILSKTWDRFQLPKPFSFISVIFGEPLEPKQFQDPVQFAAATAEALYQLEVKYDPTEARDPKLLKSTPTVPLATP